VKCFLCEHPVCVCLCCVVPYHTTQTLTMKIYRCIFTRDEVLCDNDRPLEVIFDCIYTIKGKYVEVGGEDYGISANVAEEADEGATAEAAKEEKAKVVDVVPHTNLI